MADLTTFYFRGNPVRTSGDFEAPLFCAADACDVIGIERVSDAVERIDQEDVKIINTAEKGCQRILMRGPNANVYLTESGLYELIIGSNKPEARPFKRWITAEVLPEIRKRGYYSLYEHQVREARERILEECFPNLPGPAKPIFSELIDILIKRFGWAPASGKKVQRKSGNPPWAPWLAQWAYELGIRVDGQQGKRRELNPNRTAAAPDHSMFSDETLERVREVLRTGVHFAKVSVDWADWKHKMELVFGTKALQMPIMVPMLLPPNNNDDGEAA